MNIRQELYCHECDSYVQFTLDDEMNGNHVITCPNCGHEHCRVIKDGKITDDRWSSRNGQTFYATSVSYTATSSEMAYNYQSTTAATSTSGTFLYSSWSNAGS